MTAAMVVPSLWVALRSSWVVGLLVGWVVGRLVVCWPVSWEVVVAVDIGTLSLLGECVEGPAATTADRPVAARAWKSAWLATVSEAYGGRLTIEATIEPPVTVSRNQGSENPDEPRASIGLRGVPGGVPQIQIEERRRE